MIFQFACSPRKPIAHSVGTILIHQGKNLRLVRTVVGQELENAKKRFDLRSGDQVWFYETTLEILADETGYCLVRNGKIVDRYFISAS